MANIENIKVGGTTYPLRDKNTYRSLSNTQATTLLNDGLYNDEEVDNGEIFTCSDGAIKQYEDVISYGGDKQLNFTMPYTDDIKTFGFNLQNGNYGSIVSGKRYGDKTMLVIKDDSVIYSTSGGYSAPLFVQDTSKVYSIASNNTYMETSDGITWGSSTSFNPLIDFQGKTAYFYYTFGKYVLFRIGGGYTYSYSDAMNGTWTIGSFPSGVSNAEMFVFSDEVRLIDLSTGKLYSTTDLTQSWTDTGETASLPSYLQYDAFEYGAYFKVLGDVVFAYTNMYGGEGNYVLNYSTDKGKTWHTTNLPNGNYRIAYVEKDGTFVAVRSADTSVYYVSIDGGQWSAQTPQAGTTIYGILVGGYNSAYTVSTTGASRIFTGVQHNRSLNYLNGSVSGSSAPTDDVTVGYVGQIYVDTANSNVYVCVESDSTVPTYTWKQITLTSI